MPSVLAKFEKCRPEIDPESQCRQRSDETAAKQTPEDYKGMSHFMLTKLLNYRKKPTVTLIECRQTDRQTSNINDEIETETVGINI
jgi:hypothetical protein